MSEQNDDLGLETLLSVRASLRPSVDEQLLRQCYIIQKRHQFDRDRTQSSTAMERLVETAVSTLVDVKS